MIELTKTQARQFILAKQGVMGKHRFSGKEGAYEYVRRDLDLPGRRDQNIVLLPIRG